jgi:hypothetical protein
MDEYRIGGGRLTLDLTSLETDGAEPIEIDASVAFGELRVIVPDDATVEVDASVGAGEVSLFDGPPLDGTDLEDRAVLGDGDPTYTINLEAGLGSVRVDAVQSEDR